MQACSPHFSTFPEDWLNESICVSSSPPRMCPGLSPQVWVLIFIFPKEASHPDNHLYLILLLLLAVLFLSSLSSSLLPPPILLLFLFPFFLLFFFLAPGDPPWLHNQQFSFHKSVSFYQYACARIFKAILVMIGKTWNNADAHQHRMGKLLTVYS